MSLNDPYGSKDYDYDHELNPAKNFKRNTGKRLSLRSGRSKVFVFIIFLYVAGSNYLNKGRNI